MKLTIENLNNNICRPLDAVFNHNSKKSPFEKVEAYHKALRFLPNNNWEEVVDYMMVECDRYPKPKEIIKAYYHINPNTNTKPTGGYVDKWQKARNEQDAIIKQAVIEALHRYDVVHQQAIREGWEFRLKDSMQQLAEMQLYLIDEKVSYGYSAYLLPIRFNADFVEIDEYLNLVAGFVISNQLTKPYINFTAEQLKIIRYNWQLEHKGKSYEQGDNETIKHISEVMNKKPD